MPRRRGRGAVALVAAAAALALPACGGNDFDREPRPPVPAEVNVKISDDAVVVSPREFGAGLVNFSVANLSTRDASLAIDGPTAGESAAMAPGANAVLKMETETGDYTATANGTFAAPVFFSVGPERASAENELLLP